MKDDLALNNRLVLEWPLDQPLPSVGSAINAGELGQGIVVATQYKRTHCSRPPTKRVAIQIFQRIT